MEKRFSIATQTHNQVEAPANSSQSWDLAIVGENTAVDQRSKAAVAYASANANSTLTLRFDVSVNQLLINGEHGRVSRLNALLTGKNRILIEATTLSFPEIVYVVHAASKAKVQEMRLVYVEPNDYRRKIKGSLCNHRDFVLSDNRRFQSIPMYQSNLQELDLGRAVFFVGYEGARLGQALEQIEILQSWKKNVVFGVPAFEAGWEIDAMANNVQHIGDQDQVMYAAAASAEAAYRLLSDLRMRDKEGLPILIAPLGTKPHSIGAALFLIEHESMDQAVLLYDHPTKSSGRSNEIRRWHFFDVEDATI
jgi:hypothetical protein